MAVHERWATSREPFRKAHPEKDAIAADLENMPEDFDERMQIVSRVNYTLLNEHLDLFSSVTRLYLSLTGKELPQECVEGFAIFLVDERITPVVSITLQRSKQQKDGSRKKFYYMRSLREEAIGRLRAYAANAKRVTA